MTPRLLLRRLTLLTVVPCIIVPVYAALWLLVAFHQPSRKHTVKALDAIPPALVKAWGRAHCKCCRALTL